MEQCHNYDTVPLDFTLSIKISKEYVLERKILGDDRWVVAFLSSSQDHQVCLQPFPIIGYENHLRIEHGSNSLFRDCIDSEIIKSEVMKIPNPSEENSMTRISILEFFPTHILFLMEKRHEDDNHFICWFQLIDNPKRKPDKKMKVTIYNKGCETEGVFSRIVPITPLGTESDEAYENKLGLVIPDTFADMYSYFDEDRDAVLCMKFELIEWETLHFNTKI